MSDISNQFPGRPPGRKIQSLQESHKILAFKAFRERSCKRMNPLLESLESYKKV